MWTLLNKDHNEHQHSDFGQHGAHPTLKPFIEQTQPERGGHGARQLPYTAHHHNHERIDDVRLAEIRADVADLAQRSAGCPDLICPLLNAQQGQVYTALYRRQDKKLLKLSEDLLISPADLAARIGERVYFLGAGLAVYQEQLQTAMGELAGFADSEFYYPQGAVIARLGSRQFKLGQATSALALTPYYIRRPAAEVKWEEKQASAR